MPTDVIPTPFFTRMTPVHWWNYALLAALVVVSALWAGLPVTPSRGGPRVGAATALSAVAIGCPLCNKIVVAALGSAGALSLWAPVQPLLGILAIGIVALLVIGRRRAARLCPSPQELPTPVLSRRGNTPPVTPWRCDLAQLATERPREPTGPTRIPGLRVDQLSG